MKVNIQMPKWLESKNRVMSGSFEIIKETDRAVYVTDGLLEVWLPKSQITISEYGVAELPSLEEVKKMENEDILNLLKEVKNSDKYKGNENRKKWMLDVTDLLDKIYQDWNW